jgi:hypothetical protein
MRSVPWTMCRWIISVKFLALCVVVLSTSLSCQTSTITRDIMTKISSHYSESATSSLQTNSIVTRLYAPRTRHVIVGATYEKAASYVSIPSSRIAQATLRLS